MRRLAFLLLALLLLSCQAETFPDSTTAPTTPTTQPSTTTSTVDVPDEQSVVYLFFEGYPVEPGPYLVTVSRPDANDLEGALTALLDGVSEEEATMGLSTAIPEGTSLLGVEVSDGVASVDLSTEFESGGGSFAMMGRVAQVVYTATGFQGVDSVRFLLEGAQLDVLGGEGLIIDEPQTRDDWVGLTPPILVERPSWGSTTGGEIEIIGLAELDSGTVSYVIVDAEGLIVHEGEIATIPAQRSEFAAAVVIEEVPNPGIGSIIVWEWAPDGSQRHVIEYPLTLQSDS
jgi:hypothetical protein